MRLRSANYYQEIPATVDYRNYSISAENITTEVSTKQSRVQLDLPWSVPISYISIDVLSDYDYYRPITIKLLTDSSQFKQKVQYIYNTRHTDILSSLEENEFTFPPKRSNRVQLFISNQDNMPLHFNAFIVKGFAPILKVRFTEKADYFLVYGQERASAPRYDVGNFANKIPEPLQALELGPESQREAGVDGEVGALFANSAWLWGVMALVIGLLGWFSLRMLRAPRTEE